MSDPEVTAALEAWEECPEYYVRSCATDGPIPKCASDCPGGCKGSGQRPVFPALWTECSIGSYHRRHGCKQGLVLNVTVKTLLEAFWEVSISLSVTMRVRVMEPGRICTVNGKDYFGSDSKEALSKALVATKER